MTTGSKIQWCDHTFNPWWGCARVSPGCVNCYADTLASRWGHELWRAHGPRKPMSAKYWREPLRWNRAGQARVFSGSMCDVFEAHPVPEVRALQDAARARLWELIEETPNLTWMLLTKRPGNIAGMAPATRFPRNVWLGTSVEDQTRADERIPQLLDVPAAVHFLSCEPLLGAVDLRGRGWLPVSADDPDPDAECPTCGTEEFSDLRGHPTIHRCGDHEPCAYEGEEDGDCPGPVRPYPRVRWCIVGGESGSKARPMHPEWARSLRDQAAAARVPFHFKQVGAWTWNCPSRDRSEPDTYVCAADNRVADEAAALADGGDWQGVWKVGKAAAGRELDGETWDEFPADAMGWSL